MSTFMSWLARVSLCVALAAPALVAAPASAESKSQNTERAGAQKYTSSDLQCLSEALYFEARGEGTQGQKAVAEVILNRVDHPKFPKSVCGVVNQKGQFTYNKKGRIREKGAFARAQKIAMAALQGAPRALTKGATYYHANSVRPSWSRKFERTARIGRHAFYRADRRLASN